MSDRAVTRSPRAGLLRLANSASDMRWRRCHAQRIDSDAALIVEMAQRSALERRLAGADIELVESASPRILTTVSLRRGQVRWCCRWPRRRPCRRTPMRSDARSTERPAATSRWWSRSRRRRPYAVATVGRCLGLRIMLGAADPARAPHRQRLSGGKRRCRARLAEPRSTPSVRGSVQQSTAGGDARWIPPMR